MPFHSIVSFPDARASAEQAQRPVVKTILVLLIAFLLVCAVAVTFWFQDWRYALPTPRPAGLIQPQIGTIIPTSASHTSEDFLGNGDGRPVLLHFFNPDCPCSRFNLDHVRDLVSAYGTRVRFIAIVETSARPELTKQLRNYGLPMQTIVADTDGDIAHRYGVYSTPQAVLLTADGRLRYRGNYNVSRYCTEKSTEFARLALEAALKSSPSPMAARDAVVAYGCSLPSHPAVNNGESFSHFCARCVKGGIR